MARLLVGLPALPEKIEIYGRRFDLVEVRPVDGPLPAAAGLRKWRKAVPPGFCFSVVLPSAVGELAPGPALDAALTASLSAAAALEARCVVLRTPPSVRPTAANRRRLAALFERIPADGQVRCWEPAGIWEPEEVIEVARGLGVLPVLDAAREELPPGPIAYTRLRALGSSRAIGATRIERVAERLRQRREAFVVIESDKREGQRLRRALIDAVEAARSGGGLGPMVVRPMSPTLIAEDEEQ